MLLWHDVSRVPVYVALVIILKEYQGNIFNISFETGNDIVPSYVQKIMVKKN